MVNLDLYLKNLTGKDENQALNAASYMINNADVELFSMLVNKSDFLFDFVRNNVEKRIEKVVNKENFINIIKFFDCYSSYYDDLFASILSKHANQDLTDEIFELLDKGNIAQKTYAAKYFSYIPDTVALELLSKLAFDDDENLAYNCSQALGQMQDDVSFDIALNYLTSNDDFERLKAVKFFTAYGNDFPLKEIINAMTTSKMPENIAGQIPYMVSLTSLLNSDKQYECLLVLDNIFSGLGEILPLSDVFQFELYEILNKLISINNHENINSGKIAKILLSAYSKFKLFTENQEYIFDEDKDTKYEISSIFKLLQNLNNDFWTLQKQYILKELEGDDCRILSVLNVIAEYNINESIEVLKSLLNTQNEILICELLNTLKSLNAIDDIDLQSFEQKVQNPNIKAIIANLK